MDSDTQEQDFEYSRQIYHDILAKGSEAMEEMMEVARSTEHPRAFEVLATTMKTLADVNSSLLDLHKKKKEISKKDEPKEIAGTTNNNLFVGSTAELQKMLIGNTLDPEEDNIIDINSRRDE